MINHLVQYFIQNDHLDLLGIGTLKWSKQEAFWKDGVLMAPHETIVFETLTNKPSKQFYSFLAEGLNISMDQAMLQYEAFIEQFINEPNAEFKFGSIGTLTKNGTTYQWSTQYKSNIYYQNLDLNNIEKTKSNETFIAEYKGNKWWIWAILFSVIALGLIVYKFL